jgi:hypothetical protein
MRLFSRLNLCFAKLSVALFVLGLSFLFSKDAFAQTVSRQDFKFCRAGLPEATCYTAEPGRIYTWNPGTTTFVPQLELTGIGGMGYGFILHIDLTITAPNGGGTQTRSCDTAVISRSGGAFASSSIFLTNGDVICSNGTHLSLSPENPGETYTIHLTSRPPGSGNTCGDTPCYIIGTPPYPVLNIDSTITIQNGVAPATPAPQIRNRATNICYTATGGCADRSNVRPEPYSATYWVRVRNPAEVPLTALTLNISSIVTDSNTSIAGSRNISLSSPLAPGATAELRFSSYNHNGQTTQATNITAVANGTYTYENGVTGNISQFQIVYHIGMQASTCDNHDACDLDSCGPGFACHESPTLPGIWECVEDAACDLSSETCSELGGYCIWGSDPCPGEITEASDCTRCCLNNGTPTSEPGTRPSIRNPEYTGPRITDIISVIRPISRFLYYLGIFLGVAFMIYAGYQLMMSEGDPQKIKAAQEQLTAALFGLLFILLSAAIIRIIVSSLLGGAVGF